MGIRTQSLKHKETGYERLRSIVRNISDITFNTKTDLVVVEGPSFASKGRSTHQIAGLWWLVTYVLHVNGQPFAVAPPTVVKKYLTGKGTASKDDMVREATKRYSKFDGDNNQADALALLAIGADKLGVPFMHMPQVNRSVLDKVDWPESVISRG